MNFLFSFIAALGLILFAVITLGGMLGLLAPALSIMGACMAAAVVALAAEKVEG